MKCRFLLSLSIAFLPLISIAQQLSSLTIFSENGEKFTLFLDGEQKNMQPMMEMRLRDLAKPSYDARIIFANSNSQELNGTIKTTTPRGWKADVTYKLVSLPNGIYSLRCLGVVPIKDNSQIGTNESSYSGTESAETAQFIDYTQPETKTTRVTTITDENDNKVTTTSVRLNYGQRDNSKENAAGCIAMDNRDFERAKVSVGRYEMEDQKLMAANDVANSNCFTSEQVLQILNLFSLERTKLSFAKTAYGHTVDHANYFKVNLAFEAEETKKELYDYVSSTQ